MVALRTKSNASVNFIAGVTSSPSLNSPKSRAMSPTPITESNNQQCKRNEDDVFMNSQEITQKVNSDNDSNYVTLHGGTGFGENGHIVWKDETEKETIPFALRSFVNMYRILQCGILIPVPRYIDVHYHTATASTNKKVRRRLRRIDVSFTLICAVVFACMDYLIAFIIRQYTLTLIVPFDKELRMISGSITTIFHSITLTVLLSACFYYNSVHIATPANTKSSLYCATTTITSNKKSIQKINPISTWFDSYIPSVPMPCHRQKWWQDAANGLLQLCTGYMIYDAIVQFGLDRIYYHNRIWRPVDLLFLGHHGATALYMTSTRFVQAGHISAMILMLTGEMTAPMMNMLRISFTIRQYVASTNEVNALSSMYWLTRTLHPHLEYWFSVFYFVTRGIVGPVVELHLIYDLLLTSRGRKNVPILISLLWMGLSSAVILGSTSWIINCWKIITTGKGGILQ